jgi:hypothetical protein
MKRTIAAMIAAVFAFGVPVFAVQSALSDGELLKIVVASASEAPRLF